MKIFLSYPYAIHMEPQLAPSLNTHAGAVPWCEIQFVTNIVSTEVELVIGY